MLCDRPTWDRVRLGRVTELLLNPRGDMFLLHEDDRALVLAFLQQPVEQRELRAAVALLRQHELLLDRLQARAN